MFTEKKGERQGVVLEVSDTGNVKYYYIIISRCNRANIRMTGRPFLGVGIPEEHFSNIFQRFYRVESHPSHDREGTGIGLALVKELVARHDGEIHVTSQANVGTTFRIWIPAGFYHLPQQQVYFGSKRDISEFDAEYENQIYSDTNLYLHKRMQKTLKEEEESSQKPPNESDQNSSTRTDSDSLSSTSSPRSDGWSALHMEPSYVEFDSTRKYILVVDDNADMRYVGCILIFFLRHFM